ncbi:MAG: hypothetical protein VX498_11710 [Myxococcota bacterium]|nr:hypothetical protein [Myxococcota bacterium]
MSPRSSSFFFRLTTILSLRLHLHYRRRAARGWTSRLGSILVPLVLAGVVVMIWGAVGEVAQLVEPPVVISGLGLVLAAAHLLIFFEVVTLVGRGEGMASALHHFPLSPALIHSSEMIASAATPAMFLSATVILSGARYVGGPPGLAFVWSLLVLLYLVGMRRMLQLLLANLLRRRFLREGALALVSTGGLVLWLGSSWISQQLQGFDYTGWLAQVDSSYWVLPVHWFVLPFSEAPVGVGARVVAGVGGPLLALAVLVIGFDLQDRAVFGESRNLLPAGRNKSRVRGFFPSEWMPFSILPAAIWATAIKELRVVRRDPFMMVMLVTETVILLALPFLLFQGGSAGAGYLPFFAVLLVMGQSRPAFNSLGTEGRALRFLAQTPVSRWQVITGKNLAYFFLFGVTNAISLLAACWLFGGLSSYPLYLGLMLCGLGLLLGLGNLVSVWIPIPWIGARAAAGGVRSAAAAAEGGVDRPGCGALFVRMLLLQTLPLLMLPIFFLVFGVRLFAPALWGGPVLAVSAAWVGFVYGVTTLMAVRRLQRAEERLLELLAGRGAA